VVYKLLSIHHYIMSLVIVQGGLSERQERSSKEVMHAIEQKL